MIALTLDQLAELVCGRCLTVIGTLGRDPNSFDWVALRTRVHAIARWNRRSLCGYHENVPEFASPLRT